jgi:hypothetical protein
METTRFSGKTLGQIRQLKNRLSSKPGKVYQSLGHFLREIELVKFPYLKDSKRFHSKHGRNVYKQTQYESILRYCIDQYWIVVIPNPDRYGWFNVIVTNKASL